MLVPYSLYDTRENVGKTLAAFTRALLDHVANDAKTSSEVVKAKFERVRTAQQMLDDDMNHLQQVYNDRHMVPRMEAQAAYDHYMHEQMMNKQAFLHAKTRDHLQTWVAGRFDERHHAPLTDRIYTKYVHDV